MLMINVSPRCTSRYGTSAIGRAGMRTITMAVLLTLFAAPTDLLGQARRGQPADTVAADTLKKALPMRPINVTVTRSPKEIFETAAPVSVIDQLALRERTPNTAADMLRDLPGLDVNGVGANQARPIIRGQRGQRILLLEDGLRLNNSRRQQDFGELPAIIDVNELQRIEVVRGPASVLYGSDAIGGVVNLITDDVPSLDGGDQINGWVRYVFRGEGSQHRPSGNLSGRVGRLGFRLSGAFRDAEPYMAPAGSFGDITLSDNVLVEGTGVRDDNINLLLDYQFPNSHNVFGRMERYRASDAGFGFVSNEDLGIEDGANIDITYPDQSVDRFVLGYRGRTLGTVVADRLDVTGYYQNNERDFVLDVFVPFGPGTPPGAGVSVVNQNFTDIESTGFRIEAAKLASERVLLTYGLDFAHDDSQNTDNNVSTVLGFGPPMVEETDVPTVPNATYRQIGAFAQTELTLHDRLSLIVGGRWQSVRAETALTPGLEDEPVVENSDGTFVGAANLLFEVTPELNLVAAIGRGFRAPNLVELFFNGATPEGSGFQVRNPELRAETSFNMELGLKYRRSKVAFEGYLFRNQIRNGIRIAETGETVGPFDAFQNVNIDKLRFQGYEVSGEYEPFSGFTFGASYSSLSSKDVLNPNNPIGDTYSSKLMTHATYRAPDGRFWASYRLRHSGEQKDSELVSNPIGDVLPGFTVHDLRGGIRLLDLGRTRHSLGISVENLTNELYAEFSNATFFRPEPKRTLLLSWITSF